ncbi:hypothetical protein NM688_g8226 [Phlebia brevispora]|uniref:Uncharacterized protein n=1 Tax=Phlebia brevispora TaxID=194682 RepID=A0ACC1RVN7_9APHY|nr:hypothetical protein NM688_g8226 [Phlebia brevispora]
MQGFWKALYMDLNRTLDGPRVAKRKRATPESSGPSSDGDTPLTRAEFKNAIEVALLAPLNAITRRLAKLEEDYLGHSTGRGEGSGGPPRKKRRFEKVEVVLPLRRPGRRMHVGQMSTEKTDLIVEGEQNKRMMDLGAADGDEEAEAMNDDDERDGDVEMTDD